MREMLDCLGFNLFPLETFICYNHMMSLPFIIIEQGITVD